MLIIIGIVASNHMFQYMTKIFSVGRKKNVFFFFFLVVMLEDYYYLLQRN